MRTAPVGLFVMIAAANPGRRRDRYLRWRAALSWNLSGFFKAGVEYFDTSGFEHDWSDDRSAPRVLPEPQVAGRTPGRGLLRRASLQQRGNDARVHASKYDAHRRVFALTRK